MKLFFKRLGTHHGFYNIIYQWTTNPPARLSQSHTAYIALNTGSRRRFFVTSNAHSRCHLLNRVQYWTSIHQNHCLMPVEVFQLHAKLEWILLHSDEDFLHRSNLNGIFHRQCLQTHWKALPYIPAKTRAPINRQEKFDASSKSSKYGSSLSQAFAVGSSNLPESEQNGTFSIILDSAA